jgi:putative DNA-invertase from lambdoid prophage Rac
MAGYCRVSTAEQVTNGDSLDTQRQQITAWALLKGWTIAEFFIEAGVSGSVPLADRPEGQRLLATVGPGDVIIAPKLDRAFRSAADALATLEVLKEQGVGLHLIDLGGDVISNGVSKLIFTILSAVAEAERDRLRERIREVKRHLASQGVYGGGKRPFGFDIVDGKLVPNPAEQAAIADMKAMREQGAKLRQIGERVGLPAMTVKRVLERHKKSPGS